MKKVILTLVIAALVAPASFSQIVRSTTFTKPEVVKVKEKSRIDWYVRLGLSCNNLTGGAVSTVNKQDKDYIKEFEEGEEGKSGFGTRVGYDIEFGFNKFFGKSNLYWGMEIGLGTRGGSYHWWYKYTDEDYTSESSDKCWVNSYGAKLVPFQIGYRYPVTEKIAIDAHLGIWMGCDFAGTYTEDESYESTNYEKETFKESWDFFDGDYVRGLIMDAGMQLGIGVWYGRFNLNFTWQRGFAPMMSEFPYGDTVFDKNGHEQKYNSSNAIISLGIAF